MTIFPTKEHAPKKGDTILYSLVYLLYQTQHLAHSLIRATLQELLHHNQDSVLRKKNMFCLSRAVKGLGFLQDEKLRSRHVIDGEDRRVPGYRQHRHSWQKRPDFTRLAPPPQVARG